MKKKFVEQKALEACAIKKVDALQKVVTTDDEHPCPVPADVAQLDSWIEDLVSLHNEYKFPINELLRKVLPRTSRMMNTKESEPIRPKLRKKLVACISDMENPTTIERVMREYQHEELSKPTHKQIVERTKKILQNHGERINGSHVKKDRDPDDHVKATVDIDTENFLIEATTTMSFEELAKVVGTHYLYNGDTGKRKVILTPYGRYNLLPEKDVIEKLAKHNIVWWGLTPERKIVDDKYERVF